MIKIPLSELSNFINPLCIDLNNSYINLNLEWNIKPRHEFMSPEEKQKHILNEQINILKRRFPTLRDEFNQYYYKGIKELNYIKIPFIHLDDGRIGHTVILFKGEEFREISYKEDELIIEADDKNNYECCYPKTKTCKTVLNEIDKYLIPDLLNIVNEYNIYTRHYTHDELYDILDP